MDVFTLLSAGGASSSRALLSDLETQLGSNLIGCTIMRIRGELTIQAQNAIATATDAVAVVNWGIQVLNAATAVPGPNPALTANRYDDWMAFGAHSLTTSDGVNMYRENSWVRVPIDVRSRRKVDEVGQELRFAIGTNVGATLATEYALNVSVLVALP